jgi:hypothetical protein
MIKLLEIGFEIVGNWEISKKDTSRIAHTISSHSDLTDLIYAFVSDNQVKYIGMTDSTLKKRMDLYKSGKENGTAGSTNKKVHTEILRLLKNQKKVDIYVLSNVALPTYKGFRVSIAFGIELSLIEHFENSTKEIGGLWNKRGTTQKGNYPSSTPRPNGAVQNPFSMELKQESYTKGVISFGKKYAHLLPENSCAVLVKIGNAHQEVASTFTLSGGNRKIGFKNQQLKKWFDEEKLGIGSSIMVEIVNTNKIKIYSSKRNFLNET